MFRRKPSPAQLLALHDEKWRQFLDDLADVHERFTEETDLDMREQIRALFRVIFIEMDLWLKKEG